MNNTCKLLGLIALATVIAFSACDNGTTSGGGGDIIPAKWQGTYTETTGNGSTTTLQANGTVSWANWNMPDGSRTGATIRTGGTFIRTGGTFLDNIYTGEWVYLAFDGVNEGIIVYYTPAQDGINYFMGLGYYGANGLLSGMSDAGATLSPPPDISGFPTDYRFSGKK